MARRDEKSTLRRARSTIPQYDGRSERVVGIWRKPALEADFPLAVATWPPQEIHRKIREQAPCEKDATLGSSCHNAD